MTQGATLYLLLQVSLLLLSGNLGLAQPANSVQSQDSLLSAYFAEAIDRHPDIEAMRAMVAAESSRAVMNRAWMNPELRGGLMNTPEDFNTRKDPMTMWQIGVMQQVPFPGKLKASAQAGEALTRAAKEKLRTGEFAMVEMVAMAYYDLAAALAIRETLERGRALTQQIADAALAMLSAGMGSQTDVLRARLELEQWNQKLVSNDAEIERKRSLLAYAVGRADVSTLSNPLLPDSLPPEVNLEEATQQSTLDSTPAVSGAFWESSVAEANVRRSKLSYWPDVDVMLSYGLRGDLRTSGMDPHTGEAISETVRQDNMVSIELSFPVPLFYRGNQRAQIAEARAMARARRRETENARLAAQLELRELHSRLQERRKNFRIVAEKTLPQATDSWRSALADYRSGRIPFMSLAEARMSVVMAEMDGIMNRADAWTAFWLWQATLGRRPQVYGER